MNHAARVWTHTTPNGLAVAVYIGGQRIEFVTAACPEEGWYEVRPWTFPELRRPPIRHFARYELRDVRDGHVVAESMG